MENTNRAQRRAQKRSKKRQQPNPYIVRERIDIGDQDPAEHLQHINQTLVLGPGEGRMVWYLTQEDAIWLVSAYFGGNAISCRANGSEQTISAFLRHATSVKVDRYITKVKDSETTPDLYERFIKDTNSPAYIKLGDIPEQRETYFQELGKAMATAIKKYGECGVIVLPTAPEWVAVVGADKHRKANGTLIARLPNIFDLKPGEVKPNDLTPLGFRPEYLQQTSISN